MGKSLKRVTRVVVARLVRMTEVAMVVNIGDDSKIEKGGELVTMERWAGLPGWEWQWWPVRILKLFRVVRVGREQMRPGW